MELDGGGQEALRHLLVQGEGRLDDAVAHLHDGVRELVQRAAQMLVQDRVVDGVKRLGARETDGRYRVKGDSQISVQYARLTDKKQVQYEEL